MTHDTAWEDPGGEGPLGSPTPFLIGRERRMGMLLGKNVGVPTGNATQDIRTLFDYVAYLTEQLEYSSGLLEKRVKALEQKGESET